MKFFTAAALLLLSDASALRQGSSMGSSVSQLVPRKSKLETRELSQTVVDAFQITSPRSMTEPDKDLPKESGTELTWEGTGHAFKDGWYYNTTRTEDKQHYLYMWQHACAFTKWIPSNQFMFANMVYDPSTMTLERFGLIGTDRKCYWGCIGVLWKRPLPVSQILPNGGGAGGNAGNGGNAGGGNAGNGPANGGGEGGNAGGSTPGPVTANPALPGNSVILTSTSDQEAVAGLFPQGTTFTKAYNANMDGWKIADFNKATYGKGKFMIVIKDKLQGAIFGSFIDIEIPENPARVFQNEYKSWFFYIKDGQAIKLTSKNQAPGGGMYEYDAQPTYATQLGVMTLNEDCNLPQDQKIRDNFFYIGQKYWKTGQVLYNVPEGTTGTTDAGQAILGPGPLTFNNEHLPVYQCQDLETYIVTQPE